MADFGIKVSTNNTDVSAASNAQMVLTSQYPLAKLDRTKQVSFQNIQIFFADEPPAPPVSPTPTITTTFIYKFAHGYPYRPSIWSFCQATGVTGQFQGSTTYFEDNGLIGGSLAANAPNCQLFTGVDDTYCYVYVTKYTGTVGPAVFVAGALVNIRFYVFVEDLGM